jgi:Restriction endonuclease BglII
MRLDHVYDHHNAVAEWERRDMQEWLADVFEAPGIRMREGCTSEIREHVRRQFEKAGWAINVKIDQGLGLSVFAMRQDLAFHLQTGNISRAAYDLLKLQHLYQSGRIEAAALALPTRECALQFGSNVANADRITTELELFSRIVTVPIVVIAFK